MKYRKTVNNKIVDHHQFSTKKHIVLMYIMRTMLVIYNILMSQNALERNNYLLLDTFIVIRVQSIVI